MERYLKLFTFIPLNKIHMIMQNQRNNASRRPAQHLLAKEVVELAHGANAAKNAELAHKDAFGRGTNIYSLLALKKALQRQSQGANGGIETKDKVKGIETKDKVKGIETKDKVKEEAPLAEDPDLKNPANLKETFAKLTAYKKAYLGSSTDHSSNTTNDDTTAIDRTTEVVTIPNTIAQLGTFSQVLHAAGLVSSKSEGARLIKGKGAYVVVPNSGTTNNPNGLRWTHIPDSQVKFPMEYLVDQSAIVLRTGKSKIKICRVIPDEQFEAHKLNCPGWTDLKAKRAEWSTGGSETSDDQGS